MSEDVPEFIGKQLDEDEAIANAGARRVGMPWRSEPQEGTPGGLVIDDLGLVGSTGGLYAAQHIARHDPRRTLADVASTRALLAEILAEPHYYVEGDSWFSCSQAVPEGFPDRDQEPGSGCSDEKRAGKPCDCGRDKRVHRRAALIAARWADCPGYKQEWKP